MWIEKYFGYIFVISLIVISFSLLYREIGRSYIGFKEKRIPICFEEIPSLIFNNFYDNSIPNFGFYRRGGKIFLINCNSSAKICFYSETCNYLNISLEGDDKVETRKEEDLCYICFYSSASGNDCDEIAIESSFVIPENWNKTLSVGGRSERRCKGEKIREYFIEIEGAVWRVIEK